MLQPYRGMAAKAPSGSGSPENRTAVRLVSDSTGHRCQPRCTPTPLSCASGMDVSVVARKRALSRTSPPSAGVCRPPSTTPALTPSLRPCVGQVRKTCPHVAAGQLLSGACPPGNLTSLRTGFLSAPQNGAKRGQFPLPIWHFFERPGAKKGNLTPVLHTAVFPFSPELVPRSKPRWQGPGTRSRVPALG